MLPISASKIAPVATANTSTGSPVSPTSTLTPISVPQGALAPTKITVKRDAAGTPILVDSNGTEVRGLVSQRGNKWLWTTADGRQGESAVN